MVGFHNSQMNIRENKLFNVPFCTADNYSSVSYFRQVLMLANKIADFVDFFIYVLWSF